MLFDSPHYTPMRYGRLVRMLGCSLSLALFCDLFCAYHIIPLTYSKIGRIRSYWIRSSMRNLLNWDRRGSQNPCLSRTSQSWPGRFCFENWVQAVDIWCIYMGFKDQQHNPTYCAALYRKWIWKWVWNVFIALGKKSLLALGDGRRCRFTTRDDDTDARCAQHVWLFGCPGDPGSECITDGDGS